MKCTHCNQELPDEPIIEDKPEIIGYTKRRHGFNYFKYIEVGSPIYSFQGLLFLEQEKESDGAIHRVKYYKEQLDKL